MLVGDKVHINNRTDMIFTIVEIDEDFVFANVEPQSITLSHTHNSVNGECECEKKYTVEISKLTLFTN